MAIAITFLVLGLVLGTTIGHSDPPTPTIDPDVGMWDFPWFNASIGVNAPKYILNDVDVSDILEYPEQAASYIIFNSSNEVYAKNGATGQIDYGGSWDAGGVDGGNASAVILATTQAMSRGQTLMLKYGTYSVDTQILIEKQINILGEGWGAKLSSSITNGDPVLNFSHPTHLGNTLVANFHILGNGAEGDGIYFTIPYRQNLFSNLRIQGVGGDGIHLHDGYDVGIEYVFISGCTGNGIYIDSTNQVTIFRSTMRTCDKGIETTDSVSLQVIGCEFSGNDNASIHLNDDTFATTIIGNGFEPKKIGILVNGSSGSGAFTVLVDGNYFNAEVGAEVNIKVDYGGGLTYGSNNRMVDANPQRFNITDNAGNPWEPNIIHFSGGLGANVNYTYTLHITHQNGNWNSNRENGGTLLIKNNWNIAHGLPGIPTMIQVTPFNNTYDGVPVIANVDGDSIDDTNVRVGLYWVNGTAITTEALLVSWYAVYEP